MDHIATVSEVSLKAVSLYSPCRYIVLEPFTQIIFDDCSKIPILTSPQIKYQKYEGTFQKYTLETPTPLFAKVITVYFKFFA